MGGNVHLEMIDLNTGKPVQRTISDINAYSSGSVCWEKKGESDQRERLESWIEERGNQQHNTKLKLVSWNFSK